MFNRYRVGVDVIEVNGNKFFRSSVQHTLTPRLLVSSLIATPNLSTRSQFPKHSFLDEQKFKLHIYQSGTLKFAVEFIQSIHQAFAIEPSVFKLAPLNQRSPEDIKEPRQPRADATFI